MYKFFWKLSFAYHMQRLINCPFREGWDTAEAAWVDNKLFELNLSAYQAVWEEIDCWGE